MHTWNTNPQKVHPGDLVRCLNCDVTWDPRDGLLMLPDCEDRRPPLGLRPAFLVVEERVREVTDAMARYAIAGQTIPDEWHGELVVLTVYAQAVSKRGKAVE